MSMPFTPADTQSSSVLVEQNAPPSGLPASTAVAPTGATVEPPAEPAAPSEQLPDIEPGVNADSPAAAETNPAQNIPSTQISLTLAKAKLFDAAMK